MLEKHFHIKAIIDHTRAYQKCTAQVVDSIVTKWYRTATAISESKGRTLKFKRNKLLSGCLVRVSRFAAVKTQQWRKHEAAAQRELVNRQEARQRSLESTSKLANAQAFARICAYDKWDTSLKKDAEMYFATRADLTDTQRNAKIDRLRDQYVEYYQHAAAREQMLEDIRTRYVGVANAEKIFREFAFLYDERTAVWLAKLCMVFTSEQLAVPLLGIS